MRFSTHEEKSIFRKKLIKNDLVVGTWVNTLKDPLIAKMIGYAGFDYMLIDEEHSGVTMASISEMCVLSKECGVYPMIRPVDPDNLKMNGRLLDAGVMGLFVSHIENAAHAKAIVNSMRYFNGGTRGCNSRSIASGFEKVDEEMMHRSDKEVTCLVSFESESAIEQADEILAVDGVDIASIGRTDLSHDLGLSGRNDDDRVIGMVEKVFEAAKRNNKVAGLLVNNAEEAKHWINKGVRFLSFGSEVTLLLSSYQNGIKAARAAFKEIGSL